MNYNFEKEAQIRKRILAEFNKRPEEFESLRAYNDYLEEIEDIIYNLVNDLDVIATNAKIEMYRKQNRENIAMNTIRKAGDRRAGEAQTRTQVKPEAQQRPGQPQGGPPSEYQPQAMVAQQQQQQPLQPKLIKPAAAPNANATEENLSYEEAYRLRLLRAQAGGYKHDYPIVRAYEEAFSTVYPLAKNQQVTAAR
eukprot:GEZU01022588.1.p1 GENE.GEZU01022588.1~~GEZU01022588.1.p1  ORF type:complete len:195 (+),score=51.81 GEZU01022588.1:418-1002(+)